MKVKILVIRFSSIGDIVLTTPVVRCLKNQLEGDVEIHYLTKKSYISLLNSNPYISKVYSIEKSTNECIKELKAEDYDYVVDLHKNLRSSRVKKALSSFSFSFNKLNFEKWLLVNLKIKKLPNIHIVNRYLNSVKALGIEDDGKGLDYFLPNDFELSYVLPPIFDQSYIAIVLGANHATKKIPENKLKELLKNTTEHVVLIGGNEDAGLGESLATINELKIFNAAGKSTLNESAFLIKNSKAVITPDTGMMHIAAAFQKKIISVWGNTIPEFGMYPFMNEENKSSFIVIENNNLRCRPCSKIGFDKCPKGHFNCMNELSTSEILIATQ